MTTDAYAIYESFMRLGHSRAEPFVPEPGNVARWLWHIRNAPKVLGTPFTIDQRAVADIEDLRRLRHVVHFQEFPLKTRQVYLRIAECFAGHQVYACGSRVDGDYIDADDSNFDDIRAVRLRAFKADKIESDFDFYVEGDVAPIFPLDKVGGKADRLKIIHHMNTVEVPVFEPWDFSRLPAEEHEKVADALTRRDARALLEIHDRYRLSPYTYCCDQAGLFRWFEYGISSGKIVAMNVRDEIGR